MLALAERELALVRGGDVAALPAAIEARARVAATLGTAPAPARSVLERLVAVQEQIIVELTLAGAEVARELGTLHRGRGAVQGYRSASAAPAARVERSA